MKTILSILLLFVSIPSLAANHFIRSAATGTATGADWTNAFTDIPTNLTRGDVYYIAGGNYGQHAFNDADSGSLVIELRAATIADHGTATGWSDSFQGQAVFTPSVGGTNQGCVMEFTKDHYLLNGNGVRNADWQGGYLIKVDDSNTNAHQCVIDVGIGAQGTPLAGTWVQDITIDYVESNGTHAANDTDVHESGVMIRCGSIGVLRHSYVHDGGGVLLFVKGKHDGVSTSTDLCASSSTGNNWLAEYNYFARDYSTSAQHGEGTECDEGQYCIWRYNHWRDITGTAVFATPSGGGRTTNNVDNQWDIYGNTILGKNQFNLNCAVACQANGLGGVVQVFDCKFSGDINIYNNTIANLNTSTGTNNSNISAQFLFPGAECDMQNVNIRNNYWYNNISFTATTSCPAPNTCVSFTWDNSFYSGGQTTGSDSNAQTIAGNLLSNVASEDFRLTSNTNAGVTLASPFNTDLLGVSRGVPAAWSRGAFQFVGVAGSFVGGSRFSNGVILNFR